MNVSKNELTSLYKQALEGCGLECGVYENAAESTVWAQMIGCEVAAQLSEPLHLCFEHKSATVNLHESTDQSCEVDVSARTALLWGGLLCNLLSVKSGQTACYTAYINSVSDPFVLLNNLAICSRTNRYISASWFDCDAQTSVLASFAQNRAWPTIERIDLSVEQELGMLICISDTQAQALAALESHWGCKAEPRQSFLSAEQAQQNYQQALINGIEIPDSHWLKLAELSELVLVESSEQSRMGAGA